MQLACTFAYYLSLCTLHQLAMQLLHCHEQHLQVAGALLHSIKAVAHAQKDSTPCLMCFEPRSASCTGQPMGIAQQEWPQLSITRLHLLGTKVTAPALLQLSVLPQLQFLDIR